METHSVYGNITQADNFEKKIMFFVKSRLAINEFPSTTEVLTNYKLWLSMKEQITLWIKTAEEMTIFLYECLRAAGLQHHYDRFTLVGVCHAAHLLALRMEDYPLLGVHSMEDRTRLFHLVQLVKSLDLKRLVNNNVMINSENVHDGGVEDDSAVDGRFSRDGNLDEDLSEDQDENKAFVGSSSFATPSSFRRRLEFTVESSHPVHVYAKHKNDQPVRGKEPATPVQHKLLSRKSVLNAHQDSKNNKLDDCKSPHDCQNEEKLHTTRESSTLNYYVSLLQNSKRHYPRPVTSKTFTNNLFGLNDRKGISKRKISSRGMTKSIPVYEAKRTTGYNYGLPLSSPQALNNKLVGGQRISVCVRKRPLTRAECRRREADVVTTPGGDCVVVHESKEAVDLTEYILQHRFYFDHVLGEESSNEDVYLKTTFPLVQHMLTGGKATCFAYGQTGAGKTYTMLGSSPGGPGLYALAAQDIFAQLSTSKHPAQLVYVSFFEIYCGQLYDLLDHRKRLFAREDGQKVVHISGLRNIGVDSVKSLLEVISQGMTERTQGVSGINPLSSRSHALLQIQLRDLNQQTTGRMWFVDLAGSERASDAKEPDRQTRMEGAEINQSLLALKECIRSLDKDESHTPFRQSKLTQVLKDSFVGDSKTCMIANISPSHRATEHSLNTLRYADRVKELRGQGELKQKKRCEAGPSSKHDVSSDNKSQSDAGVQKNTKLKTQSVAAVRLHTKGTFLCSTPKDSRSQQKTQSKNRRGIGPEHVTSIRGWLSNADNGHWSKRADEREGRRMENVRSRSCSQRVREKCTRAPLVYEQQTKGQQNKENTVVSYLAFAKVRSGVQLREKETHLLNTKDKGKEQTKWIESRGQTENLCRSVEEEMQRQRDLLQDDHQEKIRRLRQYHQQLQQFSPSQASSSAHLHSSCPSFSSSTRGSLSSLLHSPYLSPFAQMDHNLKGYSDTYTDRVEVDFTRRQNPLLSDEAFVQNETSSKYCTNNDVDGGVREDRSIGKSESERKGLVEAKSVRRKNKRCAWAAEEEMESANRMAIVPPTNIEAQLESDDRTDLGVEGLDASHAPDNGVWSAGQTEAADYYSLESTHSSNDSCFSHPSFESQHQQALAERPLSPALIFDNKSNKQDCNILILPFQNLSEAVPPNCASKVPFSHVQATTSPVTTIMALTESFNKPSGCPVHTRAGNHPDFKAKMPVLSQDETSLGPFSYTTDPLSISLLHVDQQPATASFIQEHTSNTSLCKCKGENEEGGAGKESFLGVEIERKIVDDEDTENTQSFLEHTKISHSTAPSTSDTSGYTLLSLHDGEKNQKNQLASDYKAPASQTRHQTPLMSLPIRHKNTNSFTVSKRPEHAHKEHKTSHFITTQQLENVSGRLNTVHSNQSIETTEPGGQESNSNQLIRPTIHLFTMDNLNHAKWCVFKAHLEQLKEVKALCRKEGKLLSQQHDMAFGEYVHKLAEILETKARCVHSMRTQLQPFLQSILLNPSTQGDNHDSTV